MQTDSPRLQLHEGASARRHTRALRHAAPAGMTPRDDGDAASPRRHDALLDLCSVALHAMPPAEEAVGPAAEVIPALHRRGMSIAFRSVSCAIPLPRQRGAPPSERVLLNAVSGFIPGGSMFALMGGSGAGKTTLLDMAARRKSEGRLGGDVLFNGTVPSRQELKRDTAYIQQDDALMGWATVAETLAFAAEMKLPRTMAAAEKAARVEEVIQQMGLQLVRDTLVGSRLVRGLSGGERKRTGVACGLISKPRAVRPHSRPRRTHDAHLYVAVYARSSSSTSRRQARRRSAADERAHLRACTAAAS